MMRNQFFFAFLFLLTTALVAQEIELSQAPENSQLYARNEKDSAEVILKGIVLEKTYKGKISLKVFKDGEIYDSQNYIVKDKAFNFKSRIDAGLHQFKFELFIEKNGIQTNCFSASNVVCGDAYIITGQSNSHASSSEATYSSPYCRSFGVKTGYAAYTDAHKKVRWGNATGSGPGLKGIGGWSMEIDHGVGVWGIELMRLIVEKHKVPVCFINGGSGSSSIEQNMLYPGKPSLETGFGKLSYRVEQAGLKDHIKAIFWHQGESNSRENYTTYQASFKQLLSDWQRVYTNLQKVYLFQLHPGCGGDFQSELREAQNQIANSHKMVEIMSTNGVPGHDGCHYYQEGYANFAKIIFPLLSRDIYKQTSSTIITPPKLLRSYYSKQFEGNSAEITLQFDQDILWQEKQEVKGKWIYLKDQFFFRQQAKQDFVNSTVSSAHVEGDKIILNVMSNQAMNFITYLPSKNYTGTTVIYNGPWLRGKNTIGALSFNNRRLGQRQVIYSQKPADLKLYPRNAENKALVPVKGIIYTQGYNKAECKVYKDHQLIQTLNKNLSYEDGMANFDFEPSIEAGLNEYRVEIGFWKNGKYSPDRAFDNIVCGDVYLINGQSNSHPTRKEAVYKNEFCRSFGKNTNYSDYNPADTIWGLASGNNSQDFHVSAWGIRLMKQLVEKHKIPVAIINGGSGGSSIEYNLPQEDLLSMSSTYGRLLYRAKKAGVENHVKALIWHQGEANSREGSYKDYAGNFDTLYNAWKRDYPSIEKVYVFQIHPGCGGDRQSELREIQRMFAHRHKDVKTISTSGIKGHDGCHYTNAGYVEMGDWLAPIIAKDFYESNHTGIASPDIVEAYYSKKAKEITLVFSENIVWPSKKIGKYAMKDYFYLDGNNHVVEKGEAKGNKIVLTLNSKMQANTISYLPGHFYENTKDCYQGPWIFGENGLGALSFDDFTIKN
jgi:hypothetical protein